MISLSADPWAGLLTLAAQVRRASDNPRLNELLTLLGSAESLLIRPQPGDEIKVFATYRFVTALRQCLEGHLRH